jgi:imidazole glycerol-phosphate synthase subunit HisH
MASKGPTVEVIDLETGNIGSVLKMLARIGADPVVVREPGALAGKHPVLLPGVGHFSKAAESLEARGIRPRLDALHASDWPVLGICLGAQLLCRDSEEGPGRGLGWIPTTVRRFPPNDLEGRPLRVPHMGWQPFSPPDGVLPFAVPPGRMYFAHSFFVDPTPLRDESLCESSWGGIRFTSVSRSRNAIGAQFHPEKSHRFGMAFLTNWLAWAEKQVSP